mmetsp:Transcript_5952/g.12087  ORF Transcript_5952/g.12087 Transcript_5952/m.12087 type:complete len:244 (-) Transcript_5952:97-828(-)
MIVIEPPRTKRKSTRTIGVQIDFALTYISIQCLFSTIIATICVMPPVTGRTSLHPKFISLFLHPHLFHNCRLNVLLSLKFPTRRTFRSQRSGAVSTSAAPHARRPLSTANIAHATPPTAPHARRPLSTANIAHATPPTAPPRPAAIISGLGAFGYAREGRSADSVVFILYPSFAFALASAVSGNGIVIQIVNVQIIIFVILVVQVVFATVTIVIATAPSLVRVIIEVMTGFTSPAATGMLRWS